MSLTGWMSVVILALAQGGGEFALPARTGEPATFLSFESNDIWPATYPGFELPQPTAPPPAPALASESLSLPATRITLTWLAAGGTNGFGMSNVDCNHTLLFGYGERPPLNITPGLGLHLWSGLRDLNLPARVYDAYVDFNWRPVDRDLWGLSLGVTPGLYGDFEHLSGHTFQVTGWALGNVRFSPHWNALGGLAYVRQLQSRLLPIGGLIWSPNEDTRLELVIPKPRLVRRFRDDENGTAFWYVAGQLGGGAWAIADTPTTNVLVSYSDLRVLVGIESIHVAGRDWSLETGYVFLRGLSVDGNAAHSPSDTVVLQASIAY
jgi:hypothetical protein